MDDSFNQQPTNQQPPPPQPQSVAPLPPAQPPLSQPKPANNLKTFSILALFLIILAAGGGVYIALTTQKTSISLSPANESNKNSDSTQTPSSDTKTQNLNQKQKDNIPIQNTDASQQSAPLFQNKFIFKNYEEDKYYTINADGKNLTPLNLPSFLFEHQTEAFLTSPNSHYLLMRTYDDINSSNFGERNAYALKTSKYYIYSIYTGNLKEIPLDTIRSSLNLRTIGFKGWSYDSNKLIVADGPSYSYSSYSPSGTYTLAEYDILNGQSKKLLSFDKEVFLYYDSGENHLLYQATQGTNYNSDDKRYLVNLNTGTKKQVPIPEILNYYTTNDSTTDGLYYATKPAGDINVKTIQIFSVKEPEKLVGELELNNSKNTSIERFVWSRDYKRFALVANYFDETTKTYTRSSSIHIFTFKGSQIMSADLDDFEIKYGERHKRDIYRSSFSPDGKYFMLAAYGWNPPTHIWYIYDIENKKLYAKLTQEYLPLFPIAWY